MQNLLSVAALASNSLVVPVTEDLLSTTLGIDPGEP
jgi:hypothetical protein